MCFTSGWVLFLFSTESLCMFSTVLSHILLDEIEFINSITGHLPLAVSYKTNPGVSKRFICSFDILDLLSFTLLFLSTSLTVENTTFFPLYCFLTSSFALSTFSGFTYDILRAIAFELNNGYDLAETMTDLNIERERYITLDMKVIFNNGITASVANIDLDMFNNRCNYEWCNLDTSTMDKEIGKRFAHVQVKFYTKDIIMDEHGYHIDKDKVSLAWDDDWDYIEDKELREKIRQFFEIFKAEEIILTRSQPLSGNREFATKFLV